MPYELLPEGTYKARAISAKLGEASTGSKFVHVEFELEPNELNIASIWWRGFWTEKTWENTLKGLRIAGWKGNDLSDLSSLFAGTPEVELVVEHEEDDKGRTWARVRWVNAPGRLAAAPGLGEAESKKFAASMKGKIAAWEKTNGAEIRRLIDQGGQEGDDQGSPEDPPF